MTRPTSARGRRRLRAWAAAGVPLCRRCHARPGAPRYYVPNPLGAALAGAQLKFSAKRTRACRQCWEPFVAAMVDHTLGALVPERYRA